LSFSKRNHTPSLILIKSTCSHNYHV
jgi:hypothetical protein